MFRIRPFATLLAAFAFFAGSLAAVAYAQTTPDSSQVIGWFEQSVRAYESHNWWVFGGLLIGLVTVVASYLLKAYANTTLFAGTRGHVLLIALQAIVPAGGLILIPLMAGHAPTQQLVESAGLAFASSIAQYVFAHLPSPSAKAAPVAV